MPRASFLLLLIFLVFPLVIYAPHTSFPDSTENTSTETPVATPSPSETVESVVQEDGETPLQAALPAAAPPLAASEEQNAPIPKPTPLYDSEPLSPEEIAARARASLVNILCIGTPPFPSTSGTGSIISETGTILTNAHIGQNVLLQDMGYPIECVARIGNPAKAQWALEAVYFPEKWAQKYASTLFTENQRGTGERDYALLRAIRTATTSLPTLPLDVRAKAVTNDTMLLAAYPAEFVSNAELQQFFAPILSYGSVKEVLTFADQTPDVLALGGNPLAQQGSSGGVVINPWGHIVGIITTTSVGKTTGERELHAITLSHIERSLREDVETGLKEMISREPLPNTAADIFRAALEAR